MLVLRRKNVSAVGKAVARAVAVEKAVKAAARAVKAGAAGTEAAVKVAVGAEVAAGGNNIFLLRLARVVKKSMYLCSRFSKSVCFRWQIRGLFAFNLPLIIKIRPSYYGEPCK
jgi:hypothetical protein